MSYFHIPVLLKEVVETTDPQSGENLVDGTVGGGGHAEAILKKTSPNGKLLGIDLDSEAIIASKRKLEKYSERIILKKGNFVNFNELAKEYDFYPINIFFLIIFQAGFLQIFVCFNSIVNSFGFCRVRGNKTT